jgi:hypothetical protein
MTQNVDLSGSSTIAANMSGLPTADTFLIGVDPCPGRARLISGNSPRAWDERQAYGMTGATLVPTGDHLGVHVFKVQIWCETDETGSPAGQQWTAYQAFAAKYLAKSVRFVPGSTTPRALAIYHPVLSAPPTSVTEVVVEDVTDMIQPEDEDFFECEIHFKEYRAPVLALGKPDAAVPSATEATPTAEDGADSEMSQKFDQFNSLAGQVSQ